METIPKIQQALFVMSDEKYREFHRKLIPTVDSRTIIGVRTPQLRKFAKQLVRDNQYECFITELPHTYYDENQLHAFILSELKEYDRCIREVCTFLPFIDNWATCDQLSPKVFKKNKKDLLSHIERWIKTNEVYTVRFGIGMLMQHFLEDDFDITYPQWVSKIRSDEYYVNMMVAWYFATALAKQYDSVIPFITDNSLDNWVHNKTIQKAIESFRISSDQKDFLRTLKRK